jgi:dsDNA-specific endonuclease/ATPase MutS2
MTNAALIAKLQDSISKTEKTIAMGSVYAHYSATLKEYQDLLARIQNSSADLEAILATEDKAALREVPAADFDLAREAAWKVFYTSSRPFGQEVTRRKAAATKAARAAEQATREASGVAFQAGEKVEVHAMGYWYTGEVVRITRTGSVVCRYTSGTGTTREKTVGQEKVRKLA